MSIPLPPTKININHNKLIQNQIFINNTLINNKTHYKNPKKKSINPSKTKNPIQISKFQKQKSKKHT